MFEIIFLIFLSGYFIQSIIFSIGVKKSFPKIKESELPSATVVLAARNEEENILMCLKSLDELVYPEGKLDIIIVDDKSTDKTGEIIDNFISGKKNSGKSLQKRRLESLKEKQMHLLMLWKLPPVKSFSQPMPIVPYIQCGYIQQLPIISLTSQW